MRPSFGVVALALCLMLATPVAAESRPMASVGAIRKLGRGVVNTLSGWVEIPKRMVETSRASGAGAGWTWGLIRGVGHAFVRTAAGLYELITFPFPAPPDYAPVIQPEYVFDEPF